MKIPYKLPQYLDPEDVSVWNKVFRPTKGTSHDKTVEQSLWRRTQSEANKGHSDWKSDKDKNRKIVYYRHKYDLVDEQLYLTNTYIYVAITMEKQKFEEYRKMILSGLGNTWTKRGSKYFFGDLTAELIVYEKPQLRQKEDCEFPDDYQTLELKVYSDISIGDESRLQEMIWKISKAGMRKALFRKKPQYVTNISDIHQYLPAQVEMGCGPSSEAGVLPLHTMHEIYSINEPFSKKFIMNAQKDTFIQHLTSDPMKALNKTSDYFAKIIKAKATPFYTLLKKFYDRGVLVGPIITNNFDGIHLRYNIPEIFVRTYDEVVVMPELEFDSSAKSLFVIGCHADRRSIERRARERGLKIIYIDPEGWWDNNVFKSYPLESPQSEDLIIKLPSSEAFKKLYASLS